MTKSSISLTSKIGLPPGSLIHVGSRTEGDARVSVIDFDGKELRELLPKDVEDCFPLKESPTVSWINIDGLHDIKLIQKIGKHFGLHALLLEDIVNTRQRPKFEEFEECSFLTLKMFGLRDGGKSIVSEQVSFVLGDRWLISFQEAQGDIFDALRSRLRENKGLTRKRGADYLLYRLVDTVVDNYFYITEYFTETTEDLEANVLNSPDKKYLKEQQRLKKQLLQFRRSVSPLREAISGMNKDDSEFIKEGTLRYLRDVYEHIIQLNESIDSQRDTLANIMDLYLSGVSNRMNQVMQTLTIMASIFIPLTFIAGIYGMNFDNMPELHWEYGYFVVWGVFIVIFLLMIRFFRKKGWF